MITLLKYLLSDLVVRSILDFSLALYHVRVKCKKNISALWFQRSGFRRSGAACKKSTIVVPTLKKEKRLRFNNPSAREASRELANLTETKKLYTPCMVSYNLVVFIPCFNLLLPNIKIPLCPSRRETIRSVIDPTLEKVNTAAWFYRI